MGTGQSPEELWDAAIAALGRGRRLQAQSLLRACAVTGHLDYGARAGAVLADMALARGDLDTATRLARAAVDQSAGEGRSMAFTSLGGVLAAENDLDGAAEAFREVMNMGPSSAAALGAVNLGVTLAGSGDTAGAREAFATAIGFGDEKASPRAKVNLGVLLFNEGDVEGARAAFESVASGDNAGEAAKARLNLMVLRKRYEEPERPPEHLDAAERLRLISELQTEAARLLFASARGQRDPVLQMDLYVSLLENVDQVTALSETPDELSRAVDACRGAVRIGEMLAKRFPHEPKHHGMGMDAAIRLGDLHLARSARKDAQKWYARAYKTGVKLARVGPDNAVGPLGAARACRALADAEPPERVQGTLDEATAQIRLAAERDPANPEVVIERCLILWRLGSTVPAQAPAAAAEIIADFEGYEGTLPTAVAEALAWARTTTS